MVGAVARARGAMVMFHGNAGNISHRIGYLTMFNRLGYASLIVDYRGYGQSSGHPRRGGHVSRCGGSLAGLNRSASREGKRYRDRWRIARRRCRDMACSQASTARTRTRVDLYLGSDLGATIYRWLPVRLLARIHYDNLERIAQISAPVLIAHSPDDDIIPFSHAEALYGAAHEPKQFMKLSGGP